MTEINPPIADKVEYVETYHNKQYPDPYYWLRNKESPKVIDYLNAENEYFNKKMESSKDLVDKLYKEFIGRTEEDDESVPEKYGNYYYYYQIEKGKNYRIYCRKNGSLDAPEEVLLDLNKIAEGKKFVRLGSFDISIDHSFIAYTLDFDGYEKFTLYVKNLQTGDERKFDVSNLNDEVFWGLDNRTLYYLKRDEINRESSCYKGIINLKDVNNNQVNEELIYYEPDEIYYLILRKSRDNKFLFITSKSTETSEARFVNLQTGKLTLFKKRTFSILYSIYHHENYFYIHTNDKALNFKVLRVKEEFINDESKWEEFVPATDEQRLVSLETFKKFIVMYYRKNGLQKIDIYNNEDQNWHTIKLPESIYAINNRGSPNNYEYASDSVRFHYESLITPKSVYEYNMKTKTMKLLKKDEIFGGFNPDNYVVSREMITVRDGIKVPISIAHLKSVSLTESTPVYLYGYGSYGISIEPAFNSTIISLMERGFVYVIAHMRGGGEMGRQWYLDGKYLKKKNTFTDFIDIAKYLIDKNYTSPEKLVITGRSAGGLLMGAVLNMAPELFKVAVAGVPFVDVINTMMDASIPLTTFEWEEWGDPRKKEFFDYMYSYSPYDNVTKQKYPHMLVTAGLNDPRVAYWEPTKYVAKLRQHKLDNNDLLFKINMSAGHSGASAKYEHLKELAYEYAFILNHIES